MIGDRLVSGDLAGDLAAGRLSNGKWGKKLNQLYCILHPLKRSEKKLRRLEDNLKMGIPLRADV